MAEVEASAGVGTDPPGTQGGKSYASFLGGKKCPMDLEEEEALDEEEDGALASVVPLLLGPM